MNRVLIHIIAILGVFTASCGGGEKESNGSAGSLNASLGPALIVFDTIVNDMGKIKEGEQVIAWFEYENKGESPLLIKNIDAGCGCTVPKWVDEPLEPGKKEAIRVVFNSRGKRGVQNIRISVQSNAVNSEEELRIKAIVESVD